MCIAKHECGCLCVCVCVHVTSRQVLVGFLIVGRARKEFQVPYPRMDGPETFLCAQRGTLILSLSSRFSRFPSPYVSSLIKVFLCAFLLLLTAHYNFVEGLTPVTIFLLVGGLLYPIPAAVLGLVYMIGRLWYSVGYYVSGPDGRRGGAIILDLALLGLFGLSVYTPIYMLSQPTS